MHEFYDLKLLFICIFAAVGLSFISLNTSETSQKNIKPAVDFLNSTPQNSDDRTIRGQLESLITINISDNHHLYRSDLLTASDNFITIFDRDNFGFYQFDHDLELLRRFGKEGRGPGEFIHPIDLTVDDSGNHWISDNRQDKISEISSVGELVSDMMLPFGKIPHRFEITDSQDLVLFSLTGKNTITILDQDGEHVHSFMSIEGLTFNQRGFLLDGRIAVDEDTIYYTGTRNSMIKAYSLNGELLYSRTIIDPLEIDLLTMSDHELRTSPISALDIAVHKDKLLLLYPGPQEDKNRWKYLDIYEKNTGDYLFTYILENFSRKISLVNHSSGDVLITLGYYEESEDLSLSKYSLEKSQLFSH